jgi:hypothetical protein
MTRHVIDWDILSTIIARYEMYVAYNVKRRRVCVTIEKERVLHILSVCLERWLSIMKSACADMWTVWLAVFM